MTTDTFRFRSRWGEISPTTRSLQLTPQAPFSAEHCSALLMSIVQPHKIQCTCQARHNTEHCSALSISSMHKDTSNVRRFFFLLLRSFSLLGRYPATNNHTAILHSMPERKQMKDFGVQLAACAGGVGWAGLGRTGPGRAGLSSMLLHAQNQPRKYFKCCLRQLFWGSVQLPF